jgi:hypothetical protein
VSQLVFSVALASTVIVIASPAHVAPATEGARTEVQHVGGISSTPSGLYTLHRRLSAATSKAWLDLTGDAQTANAS